MAGGNKFVQDETGFWIETSSGERVPASAYSGKSLLEKTWAELDASYHKFLNDNTLTASDSDVLKGYMRGLSQAIAIFMSPHFKDYGAVAEEVHKRYLAKIKGDANYLTPGLDSQVDKLPTTTYSATKVIEPPVPRHSLTQEQINAIRTARSSGFSNADLAHMYKISADMVASL